MIMMENVTITKDNMHKSGEFIILGGGAESVTLAPLTRNGEALWGTEEQKRRLEADPDAAGYYWTTWGDTTSWCLTWRGFHYRTRDGGGH
jgi:hypothetical protein